MSLEAEQCVIAAMMDNGPGYDLAVETLKPTDFTDDKLRLLFELIEKFRSAGRDTDPVTLAAACVNSQRWTSITLDDPTAYLVKLRDLAASYKSTKVYIEIIKSASVGRALIDYCAQVYELTQDKSIGADDMISRAHQLLPNIENAEGSVSYRDAALKALSMINRRADGELMGVSTGIENLDDLILGFEKGTLNILAGRPSHGKSLYGMDFAHAAAKSGPVFVFSLEMTAENLAMRGLASLGSVDFGDMRAGKVDQQMVAKMQAAVKVMSDLPITIDSRAGITVDQLIARCRAMARREKPVLIVVDYLTLVSGQGENRTAQVGYVSRSLKALAKELDCPVLCLAQLNRSVDSRTDKRPVPSDLRDSGEIEQDADVILFTYLAEKYNPDTPRKGIGELICSKQRNGETGSVYTEFQGRYQRFKPFTGVVPPHDVKPEKKGKGMSAFVGTVAAINDRGGDF